MAKGQYRAPKYYGAWVEGVYYNPGGWLPLGTEQYRVTAMENIFDTENGWRSVSAIIDVGTSFDDIDDEIYSLFEDLSETYESHL